MYGAETLRGLKVRSGVEWTIHHADFNSGHNCRCNLLLLDKRIHDRLPNRSFNGDDGKFTTVQFTTTDKVEAYDEVPF